MSIASEIERLQTAKEDIVRALDRIGYHVPSGATLDDFGAYIEPYTSGHTLDWMDNPDNYLRFKFVTDGSVSWQNVKGDIQYSKNGGSTWTAFNGNTVNCSKGDEIWFKGTLTGGCGDSNENTSSKFNTTGKFYASGNVNRLSTIGSLNLTEYHFAYLFSNNDGLNIDNNTKLVLPATTLASNCYSYMFYGCSRLTNAPELPATTLADNCYSYMFYGCISLTTATALPVTSLTQYCYYGMFNGCTSLTTAPELPATTLTNSCYRQMFQNCKSITTTPDLPATTLAANCYQGMFNGCTSLTTAPELPATSLAQSCYNAMFQGCTSLTTAPELPATSLVQSCYQYMFRNCTSLNYIKCLATKISASSCTNYWVNGVSSTGTFVKNPSMSSWTTGNNGIPNGWTVQDASS